MSEKRYVDATESAKLIRLDLKRLYPGTVFSVRTDKYSGGSSIDIKWIDGPATDSVERAVGHYRGATFDGMQDLMEYHDSELNGERVQYLCNFIFTERAVSPEFLGRIAIEWCSKFGVECPQVITSSDGSAYMDQTDRRRLDCDNEDIIHRIRRAASLAAA